MPGVNQSTRSESDNSPSVISSGINEENNIDSVEGCEDKDVVARQLCEAASQEDDPFLRAALWDEYNEYKKIILRQ